MIKFLLLCLMTAMVVLTILGISYGVVLLSALVGLIVSVYVVLPLVILVWSISLIGLTAKTHIKPTLH